MKNKETKLKLFKEFFISCTIVMLLAILTPSEVFANALPHGMVIGDNNGVTIKPDGKYFIDIPSALPGEQYVKEITLRSTDENEDFNLRLNVIPKENSGLINFNEHVIMTMDLDGKQIYKGKILGEKGKDWSKDSLPLGEFKYGTQKVLKVTFDIDNSLSNEDYKEKSILLFEWQFVADSREGMDKEKNKGMPSFFKLPKTGEEWKECLYQILVGILIVLVSLLLWKKDKELNVQNNQ